ncbi:chorismate lyase [Legionella sp. W05-934-2]|uniref:chorismate--pyruvate lyase family protein n=1 Tax=Legionella sp. W05-934-2 TaxID=1198649 RepID=UPI0034634EA8
MTRSISQSHDAPDYLFPFLTDSGSLTKKLHQMTGSAVVKVMSGNLTNPDWWCQHYLKLTCDQLFQREILMLSGKYTCWYARTYIPASTWYLHSSFFEQLADKNLGDMLFDNPHVKRVSSTFRTIDRSDIAYYWPPKELVLESERLWLRLSLFSLYEKANFYLTELFLPELEPCLLQIGLPIGD